MPLAIDTRNIDREPPKGIDKELYVWLLTNSEIIKGLLDQNEARFGTVFNGSFLNAGGQTVTVVNGIITDVS